MAPAVATYAPRDPSQTVLYTVIAEHLETFLASCEAGADATGLPAYVQREFYASLRCGVVYPHVTDNAAVAQYGKIVLFHHHGRGHHHGTEPVILPTPAGRSRVDFPHYPSLVTRPFQGHISQALQARKAPA